jgi:hypothetical protein
VLNSKLDAGAIGAISRLLYDTLQHKSIKYTEENTKPLPSCTGPHSHERNRWTLVSTKQIKLKNTNIIDLILKH